MIKQEVWSYYYDSLFVYTAEGGRGGRPWPGIEMPKMAKSADGRSQKIVIFVETLPLFHFTFPSVLIDAHKALASLRGR